MIIPRLHGGVAVGAFFLSLALGVVQAEEQLKFGGTLRIASLDADLDAFDPLTGYSIDSWQILRATTRQLVTYPGSPNGLKEDTTLVPDLAASWDISDDGKTYTFHL